MCVRETVKELGGDRGWLAGRDTDRQKDGDRLAEKQTDKLTEIDKWR